MARERPRPLGYIATRRVKDIETHGREGDRELADALKALRMPELPRLVDRDPDEAIRRVKSLAEAVKDARIRFAQITILAVDTQTGEAE